MNKFNEIIFRGAGELGERQTLHPSRSGVRGGTSP